MTNLPERTSSAISSTDKGVAVALQSKKVKDCDQTELATMLTYLITAVGAVAPESHEKLVLVEYLQAKKSNYGLDEFKIAFLDAIDANLLVKPKDKVFALTTVMIGQVMDIYARKRKRVTDALRKPVIKPLPTPEENYTTLMGHVKKGSVPSGFNWGSAFLHAQRIGEIELTVEQKQKFAEKVRRDMEGEALRMKSNEMRGLHEELMNNKKLFMCECRARMMKRYIKSKYDV